MIIRNDLIWIKTPKIYSHRFIRSHLSVRDAKLIRNIFILEFMTKLMQEVIYNATINKIINPSKYVDAGNNQANIERKDWDLYITVCTVCDQYTIWENEIIIFPFESSIAEPSPDMPKEMKDIYE